MFEQQNEHYYFLDESSRDPRRIKKERERARELKKSSWWNQQLQRGECGYCSQKFAPSELTMDHVVPLARGGSSTKGNIVASCRKCNENKKLDTPVDRILNAQGDPDGSRSESEGLL